MLIKLTKTDHYEQSLRMDPHVQSLIRIALGAMLDNRVGSTEMREEALQLKRYLESPDKEDKPAIFQKTHGMIINCPDCAGTRNKKKMPEDRGQDIDFIPCDTCNGEGQLYQEVIRKSYVPTSYHRKKLAR